MMDCPGPIFSKHAQNLDLKFLHFGARKNGSSDALLTGPNVFQGKIGGAACRTPASAAMQRKRSNRNTLLNCRRARRGLGFIYSRRRI